MHISGPNVPVEDMHLPWTSLRMDIGFLQLNGEGAGDMISPQGHLLPSFFLTLCTGNSGGEDNLSCSPIPSALCHRWRQPCPPERESHVPGQGTPGILKEKEDEN